jgi:hypothetical protein
MFSRNSLLYELQSEGRDLDQEILLNNVDMELHDAFASRREYLTVEHLHGYKVMLWTNNARVALQTRQTRLVAVTVVKGVLNDILDYMLEGWLFGERESEFTVLGHVPSLKPGEGEIIRAGQDQIRTIGGAMEKIKIRAEARKKGVLLDEFRRGDVSEKAQAVEQASQFKLESKRTIKEERDHQHMLGETETTLRFGVFMMTLNYFRVMTMIKREKKSWGGEVGKNLNTTKHESTRMSAKKAVADLGMTRERLRIVDEERNTLTRAKRLEVVMVKYRIGQERRAEKVQKERREQSRLMQMVVKRNRLEELSVRCIQVRSLGLES